MGYSPLEIVPYSSDRFFPFRLEQDNLNSTDGAVLQALLKHAGSMRPAVVSVLVASDQRLLRAAKAAGLEVLNPETVNAADIPAFLAAL